MCMFCMHKYGLVGGEEIKDRRRINICLQSGFQVYMPEKLW